MVRISPQFLRFCIVGAVGFGVDAAVLMAAIHLLGLGPLWGRLLSFAVAVLATFELNRLWAFREAGRADKLWLAFARYLAVQGVGMGVNFLVYASLYAGLPPPLNHPLLCLAAASGAALLVNYSGASRLVFRSQGP